ncbi:hypothetical protein QQF64_019505 [Cirrhinus molitorella]|uniref:Uncharacterized protein n=1 Tax=Cirrhinus molitorella TaxID=172907 RepID=A0ABR3LJ04_9TELE
MLITAATAVAGSLLIVFAVCLIWSCRKHRKTDPEETIQICEEEITVIQYSTHKMYKNRRMKWLMQVLRDVEPVPF